MIPVRYLIEAWFVIVAVWLVMGLAVSACSEASDVKEFDIQCTNVCASYWSNQHRGPAPTQCECERNPS